MKRTLEVHSLDAKGRWEQVAKHHDVARVRAVPFEVVEIDLGVLWA